MTVYLIEQLWENYLENEYSASRGYEAVGYVETEAEAKAIKDAAGVSSNTGWPNTSGMPKVIYKAIPLLANPKCGPKGGLAILGTCNNCKNGDHANCTSCYCPESRKGA